MYRFTKLGTTGPDSSNIRLHTNTDISGHPHSTEEKIDFIGSTKKRYSIGSRKHALLISLFIMIVLNCKRPAPGILCKLAANKGGTDKNITFVEKNFRLQIFSKFYKEYGGFMMWDPSKLF